MSFAHLVLLDPISVVYIAYTSLPPKWAQIPNRNSGRHMHSYNDKDANAAMQQKKELVYCKIFWRNKSIK